MWFMKRNLDAEWNLQREQDWELSRALRALRNAALFMLFGLVVFVMAFAIAWTK